MDITVGSLVQAKQSMHMQVDGGLYDSGPRRRMVTGRIPLVVTSISSDICYVLFESRLWAMLLEDLSIISTPTPMNHD